MIEFKDVSFRYGTNEECLKHIDLQVNEGEVLLVCGPSGCGKSTLVRCINGLIPHFYEGNMEGIVLVNGTDVSQTTLRKLSKQVGTVFQNPRSQFFNVDTTSELAFGCENLGISEEEIERRINDVANRYALVPLMDRNIFMLSGGEKQKIACGSVAVAPLQVVVLDEPSANLDYAGICELQKMIAHWKEEKKTIIISEHRIAYLLPFIDRAVFLKDGRISRTFDADSFSALSEEELHNMGLRGRDFINPLDIELDPSPEKKESQNMILENMYFCHKRQNVLFDISEMNIPMGETIALVGENGCGKSTFLRCFCGMEKVCKARLRINNEIWKRKERLKNVYMVMQDVNHQLFTESVLDEVMISQEKEDKNTAMAILRQLDLEELAEKHPLALSGGQKQRVAVASALASEREIILFDEPTSGLDHFHMLQVAEILKKLREAGKTVMIVTHDAELIKCACTGIIRLNALQKANH